MRVSTVCLQLSVRELMIIAATLIDLDKGCNLSDFSGQFFHFFEIISFCFVVAICDLVHAVEATYGIP